MKVCYTGKVMRPGKIIIGNWKMNPLTSKEAEKLFLAASRVTRSRKNVEILICPPSPFIDRLNASNIESKVKLGAQDCFWEEKEVLASPDR